MLRGKKIVLGITGSIAAFKVPALIRLLKKEGAEVQVIMTPCARDFVTPLTLSTLSGNPVITEPFDRQDGTWHSHVDLGQWADLYLYAPVSANTLAKMAHGIADNFLLTAYLSAKCPVFFAPAMDLDMYRHPTTRRNIEILQSFGNTLIEPTVGELASGLCGAGRMEEPEQILEFVREHFTIRQGKFKGRKVLVTAGPTYENIDPVRFIGNHSSGLMGFAIAEEFAKQAAEVTLVTGPVSLKTESPSISRIDVTSAAEMYTACMKFAGKADIIIMAAAVADYTPKNPANDKMKKTGGMLTVEMVPTRDILAELGSAKKKKQLLVGFALETKDEEKNALKKLKEKNLDLIILNSLNDEGAGFKTLTNKITVYSVNDKPVSFPLKSKKELAADILGIISFMK
jgi:phosphopantothenoylcysteine decarboxylase/phosphopantothenate--cysteine ligase